MRLAMRLARLEARLPARGDLEALTYDELSALLLDGLGQATTNGELSAEAAASVADAVIALQADIRWQAAVAKHPTYSAALDHLSAVIPGFVPAVFGSPGCASGRVEVSDLEKPHVMERRAALRSRPDIRSLIEAGARETAPVEFGGQDVAAAIRSWKPRWHA